MAFRSLWFDGRCRYGARTSRRISASGLDILATSKTSHFAYRHLYVVCAQRNDLREVIHHSTVARKSIATCSRRR